MQPYDTQQVAAGYLRQAIQEMVKRAIPTDPVNFTLWYNYISKRDESLVKALDELFPVGNPYEPGKCDVLFFEHVVKPRIPAQPELQRQTIRILSQLLERVFDNSSETQSYGSVLERGIAVLRESTDQATVHETLQHLLDETLKARSLNVAFQMDLDTSHREIELLRIKLAKSQVDANSDPLTGIGNRRYFDEMLAQALEAHAQNVSLLIVDIDHFKRINDNYGHPVGDTVLRMVGRILQGMENDNVQTARYGGEEFGVILRNLNIDEAQQLAERIRRRIGAMRIEDANGAVIIEPISASVGVASRLPGESLERFLRRADTALYDAKRSGRNQVRIAA